MDKFNKFMDDKFVPFGYKIAQNPYLHALKNSFINLMPFLIIGSFFLLVSSFPIDAYKEFMAASFGENWSVLIEIPFNATFAFMGVFIAFLFAYNLAKNFNLDAITIGILSLVVFLILTPIVSAPLNPDDLDSMSSVLPLEWLGSTGLFVAMIGSVCTVHTFKFFIDRNIIIKMPEQVPPEVARSFNALIPSCVIMIVALFVRLGFDNTSFGTIHSFFYDLVGIPVSKIGTGYVGAVLTVLSITLLWSVGINSGSLVNGILRPFWMINLTENQEAFKLQEQVPHVVTEQFFDMIWMGGAGVTLGLLIAMLIKSKSQQNKKLASLAVTPAVFNINEPVLFGLPIILNPVMLIPFNLVPVVLVTIQYFAMSSGLVASPIGVVVPWTTPPVISGFLITGSISGAVIQIINLAVAVMIYYPFLKIIDNQNLKEELKDNE